MNLSNARPSRLAFALFVAGFLLLVGGYLVGKDLASGALVELMPEYRSITLGIHAVYPTRKHVSSKVRVLIDFLAGSFRQAPWPD